MEVRFTVMYHPKVRDKDVPKLSAPMRTRIAKAIEQKLTTAPHVYGKPLRLSLKNNRSLRVGEYRVIFTIQGKQVLVLLIEHRSVVYGKTKERSERC